MHAVGESGDVTVRDSQRGDGYARLVENPGWFGLRDIHHADFETNPSSGTTLGSAKSGAEQRKCALFWIEQAVEENREVGRLVVSGGPGNGQGFLADLIAEPKERGQIGYVIGMEMADGHHREVAQLGLGLPEPKKGTAAHVDQNSGVIFDPQKVAGGSAIRLDPRSAGTQNLNRYRLPRAGLRRGEGCRRKCEQNKGSGPNRVRQHECVHFTRLGQYLPEMAGGNCLIGRCEADAARVMIEA